MMATVDPVTLLAGVPVTSDIDATAGRWRAIIDARLEQVAEAGGESCCSRLASAMRYSLLASGKRVRPMLAILTAVDFGCDPGRLVDFGCALEMVHCASLMLDDLPSMDDARTRRGRPACHLEFGEATTTLAAVALLNQAYGVIAGCDSVPTNVRVGLVSRLAQAVGTAGLVSGQSRDLIERTSPIDAEQLHRINHQKTGVLFELAVVGGGMISDFDPQRLRFLEQYARHVGQAFQAADDLLDLGRPPSGKDRNADRGKSGSIHDVGEAALRQRLSKEMNDAGAVLRAMSVEGGVLDTYIRSLFVRFN